MPDNDPDNDNDRKGTLRALQEADERRKAEKLPELPVELGGLGGADPARFGDWEVNGRAIDF